MYLLIPISFLVVASDNPPGINMDFLEKDSHYLVHADMPGYKKEDIHISVDRWESVGI